MLAVRCATGDGHAQRVVDVENASLLLRESTARWIATRLAVIALAWISLVSNTSKACRFFALAALLCLLPLLLTIPQERLAIGPSFGAFGSIACFVLNPSLLTTL